MGMTKCFLCLCTSWHCEKIFNFQYHIVTLSHGTYIFFIYLRSNLDGSFPPLSLVLLGTPCKIMLFDVILCNLCPQVFLSPSLLNISHSKVEIKVGAYAIAVCGSGAHLSPIGLLSLWWERTHKLNTG